MSKNKEILFKGSACAMITPFRSGKIDEGSLRQMVCRQIEEGTSAIAVCGTTGEAPSLTDDEYRCVVRITVSQTAGKVPVIAGAGGASTKHAVLLARIAAEEGADFVLAVTPYYVKASQDGLVEHYSSIAREGLPVILYDVPLRTGMSIPMAVYRRLSEIDGIVGIKEASGDVRKGLELAYEFGDRFALYSGSDEINLPLLATGFDGFISVTANVYPREVSEMWKRWRRGDTAGALEMDRRLYPMTRYLFSQVNPIPVKAILSHMGLCENELRLPLTPIEYTE